MKYVLYIIVKAHLYLVYTVAGVVFLEILTHRRVKLLLHNFTWRKSKYMAAGSADLLSSLYFLFSLAVLVYDAYVAKNGPQDYAFWKWLAVMVPLTVLFRVVYYRLQAKDPDKKGFHID